ncbi:hypothetical protein A4S05_23570 [Nostoc sp. KVJ20]|uniref:plasmid replication protein, CyRepA1 family n=1 Tax=Nostoc sp. KVJ20 TaxID=457944 RepID=UPI00083D4688|nr:plasmid replication protein, CyRepA1 family [Nostoc sp. KVJ20]ODH02593.1 hypothetical protein A4S05_23570 [Nostoc sp. KVJ20]
MTVSTFIQDFNGTAELQSQNNSLDPLHLKEMVEDSGIDKNLALSNAASYQKPDTAIEFLSHPNEKRNNAGRIQNLKKYDHHKGGGWHTYTLDVESGRKSLWQVVKPNQKRIDKEKGKEIRYEQPSGVPTQTFNLEVTPEIWEAIAERYKAVLPENYKTAEAIAFWRWIEANPQIPLYITEGFKKTASLISRGFVAIGLPGIWNGCKKVGKGHELIPQLKRFAVVGRPIVFAFDQDSNPATVTNVTIAIRRTALLFKQQGCKCFVLNWDGEFGKGIDDLFVNMGGDYLEEVIGNAKTFEEWDAAHLTSLTKKINLRVNQRYISDLSIPFDEQLVAILSCKGSGKTELYAELAKLAKSLGKKVLGIVHRIQLGKQLGGRLGVPYIEDVLKNPGLGENGYVLCIDSLHPNSQAQVNHLDWAGAYVFIDEIVQWVRHLLSSDTCVKERNAILDTLRKLLTYVRQTGGRVFIADADLNDTAMNVIQGAMGLDKAFIIKNEQKPTPYTVYNYQDKDATRLVQDAIQALKTGKKILLHTGGQNENSKFGTQNLENFIGKKCRELGLDIKILRVDSATIKDPTHPAFGCTSFVDGTNLLNKIFLEYDLVICSPTLETGVSIDIDHFDTVFEIGQGLQECDSFRQTLDRYRKPVDRHIWVSPRGLSKVGTGDTIPYYLIQNEKLQANTTAAVLMRAGLEMPKPEDNRLFLEAYANLGAITNLNAKKYRETIIEGIKKEGHTVIDCFEEDEQKEDCKSLKKEIQQNRDEFSNAFAESVSRQESIDDITLEKLKAKQEQTPEEYQKIRRATVDRKYPGLEATPELIQKDTKGYYSKIFTEYAVRNKETTFQVNEANKIENLLESSLLPDINKRNRVILVEYLCKAKLPEVLSAKELHESLPLAVEIGNYVRANIKMLKKHGIALGLKDLTNMDIIRDMLKRTGYRLAQIGQRRINNKREKIYGQPAPNFEYVSDEKGKIKPALTPEGQLIPIWDDRDKVFANWFERDSQNEAFIVSQLVRSFKEAKDYKDVESAIAFWQAKKQFGENGIVTDAQSKLNKKIDSAIGKAWVKLQPEEALRIRSLQMAGLEVSQIINILDNEILKEKPGMDLEYLELISARWDWRLAKAVDYGQQVVDAIKSAIPTTAPNYISKPIEPQHQSYQATKAQEIAKQLDTEEGQRNQKRLEKQQQAANLVAFAANLCEKAEDAVDKIKEFMNQPQLGEFLHHIGGVLRREILDTDKFFHPELCKMMKSEVNRFMYPELYLVSELD